MPATADIDAKHLIEQVTQLATAHADLQLAVRAALADGAMYADGSLTLHLSPAAVEQLRRLIAGP